MIKERVALFVPSLCGGGAQYIMSVLANGFVARGYEVDLVLLEAKGPYLETVDERVSVVELGTKRVIFGIVPMLRYLRIRRPGMLLATQDHANLLAIAAVYLSRRAVRVVVRVANELTTNTLESSGIRNRMVEWLVPWFYSRANKVVAVSEGVAADLVRNHGLDPRKVVTIYNPVVLPAARVHEKEEVDDAPLILGVGRLVPQKDFGTMIKAFAEVRNNRDLRLVILGEGEERGSLERLVQDLGLEDQISLPGFVDNVGSYLGACAVFVLSSRHEGMPNVLLQAVAANVPVVATDCRSGPAEILENGRWGRLVPVGDVPQMAKAIRAALNGEVLRVPLENVEKRFGLNSIVEKYLSVLVEAQAV